MGEYRFFYEKKVLKLILEDSTKGKRGLGRNRVLLGVSPISYGYGFNWGSLVRIGIISPKIKERVNCDHYTFNFLLFCEIELKMGVLYNLIRYGEREINFFFIQILY